MANASPNAAVISKMNAELRNWKVSYYLWTIVFVALATLAIVMPLLRQVD